MFRTVEGAVRNVAEVEEDARGAAKGSSDRPGDHVVRTAAAHRPVGHNL